MAPDGSSTPASGFRKYPKYVLRSCLLLFLSSCYLLVRFCSCSLLFLFYSSFHLILFSSSLHMLLLSLFLFWYSHLVTPILLSCSLLSSSLPFSDNILFLPVSLLPSEHLFLFSSSLLQLLAQKSSLAALYFLLVSSSLLLFPLLFLPLFFSCLLGNPCSRWLIFSSSNFFSCCCSLEKMFCSFCVCNLVGWLGRGGESSSCAIYPRRTIGMRMSIKQANEKRSKFSCENGREMKRRRDKRR